MIRTIDVTQPLNLDFSPNRWLLARYLSIPGVDRGGRLVDLCGWNHAALTAAPTWKGTNRPGGLAATLEYNGVSQYGTSAKSISLANAHTQSAWVRLDNASSFPMVATTSDSVLDFRFNASTAKVQYGGSTIAPNAVTIGKWYHHTVVSDGSATRIYENGVLVVSASNGTTKSGTLTIGRRADGFYFPGSIDDVCVFRKALSIEEIRQVYLDSLGGSRDSLRWESNQRYKAAAAGGGNRRRRVLLGATS